MFDLFQQRIAIDIAILKALWPWILIICAVIGGAITCDNFKAKKK
jgi:hypothetical protein